jgi:hypothetical protein
VNCPVDGNECRLQIDAKSVITVVHLFEPSRACANPYTDVWTVQLLLCYFYIRFNELLSGLVF